MQADHFKKYLFPRLSVLTRNTHTNTHTHMYVHTKILVLQYFLIAYLQKARTERSFALQNDAAERKGGSYMIPLLYICSMCFHCAVVWSKHIHRVGKKLSVYFFSNDLYFYITTLYKIKSAQKSSCVFGFLALVGLTLQSTVQCSGVGSCLQRSSARELYDDKSRLSVVVHRFHSKLEPRLHVLHFLQ